jgi:hypothetical protein
VSEENADLLKRAVDAYNRRDVEALLEELDPKIEWHPALPGLLAAETTVYRAHEGIGEMFRGERGRDEIALRQPRRDQNGKGIRIRGCVDPAEAIDAAGVGSRPEPRASG